MPPGIAGAEPGEPPEGQAEATEDAQDEGTRLACLVVMVKKEGDSAGGSEAVLVSSKVKAVGTG